MTPKSFTVAVPVACTWVLDPVTVSIPLLPIAAGCGGITPVELGTATFTVTFTVAAAVVELADVGKVPRLHTKVVPLLDPQVPGLEDAVTEDEFVGKLSVKTAPLTGSPLLKME